MPLQSPSNALTQSAFRGAEDRPRDAYPLLIEFDRNPCVVAVGKLNGQIISCPMITRTQTGFDANLSEPGQLRAATPFQQAVLPALRAARTTRL